MPSPDLVIGNNISNSMQSYRERVVDVLRVFTTTNQSSVELNRYMNLLGWQSEGECFKNMERETNCRAISRRWQIRWRDCRVQQRS